jgi:hypothetical protein
LVFQAVLLRVGELNMKSAGIRPITAKGFDLPETFFAIA